MSEKKITEKSRIFYETFSFPGTRPIDQDGMIFMRRFAGIIEEYKKYKKKDNLRILDAGCGTGNTIVSLAIQYPYCKFYGIDNSAASLKKAKILTSKQKIKNIEFIKWNLMDPLHFSHKFDIIYCLGVLHHTADMKRVLKNLNIALKDKQHLFLWVYAKHGRYYHSLNLKLLNMLIKPQLNLKNRMATTNEFIYGSEKISPINELFGKTKMQQIVLHDPIWIADQFMNPHEKLIDMEELIELTSEAGFEIENLLGVNEDISQYFSSKKIINLFNKLDKNKNRIALDLLLKPERHFVYLKKRRNV